MARLANLSIPQHQELSVGTLRALIRYAGWTVEEFLRMLRHFAFGYPPVHMRGPIAGTALFVLLIVFFILIFRGPPAK